MKSKARHKYCELSDLQIRILILEPSEEDTAPLKFSFHVDKSHELVRRYEAVSYVWGEPNLEYPIHHEDGSRVWVTKNLDLALRKLRSKFSKRWLWADAICIDQENDAEKGSQVQAMGEIFTCASRVIAWLGPGGDREEQGMRALADVTRMTGFFENSTADQRSHACRLICEFSQLKWFQRLWIVQECVLSADLCLIYGNSEITLTRLVSGFGRLSQRLAWSGYSANPGIRRIVAKIKIWRDQRMIDTIDVSDPVKTTPRGILVLVEDFNSHQCSDNHDRIFALLGLAPNVRRAYDREMSPLTQGLEYMDVDYQMSILDTYMTFAFGCMESGAILEVLFAALARKNCPMPQTQPECGLEWPSWVPGWRQEPSRRCDLTSLVTQESERSTGANSWSILVSRTHLTTDLRLTIQRFRPIGRRNLPILEDPIYVHDIVRFDSVDAIGPGLCRWFKWSALHHLYLSTIFDRSLRLSNALKPLLRSYMVRAEKQAIEITHESTSDPLNLELLAVLQARTFFTVLLPNEERALGVGCAGTAKGDRLMYFATNNPIRLLIPNEHQAISQTTALVLRPSTTPQPDKVGRAPNQASKHEVGVAEKYRLCGEAFFLTSTRQDHSSKFSFKRQPDPPSTVILH